MAEMNMTIFLLLAITLLALLAYVDGTDWPG